MAHQRFHRRAIAQEVGPLVKAQEKAAGTGAELLRDLEMVVAIVNRGQRRLAAATTTMGVCWPLSANDANSRRCRAA